MTALISDQQIRAHYSMEQCIGAVERAFAAAGRSPFDVTERKVAGVGEQARLLSLSAASAEFGRLVANIYSGAPPGHDKTRSPVNRRQKFYILFDGATGACEAIISGARLARLKTGAMGAVAIKHLTPADVSTLAIIGSGRQARIALEGALAVREFNDIRVWSRTRSNADKMVSEFAHVAGLAVAESAREAVEDIEVVITATTSTKPLLEADWLADGVHINSIGAHYPQSRELDSETIRRSTVVVDTLVAARAEKGELLLAEEEGLFSFADVVGELGQIVAGQTSWERSAGENTTFASCGSAIESMGAAIGAFEAIPEAERQSFSF